MAFKLTKEMLAQCIPGNTEVAEWHQALVDVLPKYGIDTEKRMAHFISQCAHESNNFRNLEENLSYSKEALLRVFPRYFGPGARPVEEYVHQPEKLANYVYMDEFRSKSGALGNHFPGDGWKFRGRGLKQLTGRANYADFARTIGMTADEAATYLTSKKGAVESACWFWNARNLNAIADTDDVTKMTKVINGGDIGLADRKRRYEHALRVFSGTATPSNIIDFNTMIRVGSNSDTVKAVQTKLGLSVDGIFGKGTEAAVKSWQTANGLTPDGIVGPATLKKMFGT